MSVRLYKQDVLVYEFRTEYIADCKYPPFYQNYNNLSLQHCELSDTLGRDYNSNNSDCYDSDSYTAYGVPSVSKIISCK